MNRRIGIVRLETGDRLGAGLAELNLAMADAPTVAQAQRLADMLNDADIDWDEVCRADASSFQKTGASASDEVRKRDLARITQIVEVWRVQEGLSIEYVSHNNTKRYLAALKENPRAQA